MKFQKDYMPSLAGSLLVAHPAVVNPTYSQSVIILSSHFTERGSMGVIINNPTQQTMGQINSKFALSSLEKIPVYLGGPINHDTLLLAAWQWLDNNNIFKLHFGISEEQATHLLLQNPLIEMRAFLGHAEWLQGQLEGELNQHAWLLSSIKNLIDDQDGPQLWQTILTKIKPELLFLVDPEDPSVN